MDRPSRSLVVAFDLEMNQPSNRIIQIGAVAGDATTGEIVARYTRLVNPGEALSGKIAALTGIGHAPLREAAPLADVYLDFLAWLGALGGARRQNPLTWGIWDFPELRAQVDACASANARVAWPFGSRWLDVKAVYQAWRHAQGGSGLGNLERAMRHLDLEFAGRAHDALADAENTFRAYVALLGKLKGRD